MSKITKVKIEGFRNEFSDTIYPTEETAQKAYDKQFKDHQKYATIMHINQLKVMHKDDPETLKIINKWEKELNNK